MKLAPKIERPIAAIFLVAVILLLALLIAFTNQKLELDHTEDYTIQSGETLWSIASAYRPATMSIQEYIYNLEQYNNITPEIQPEQEIKILIYKEV